MILFSLQLTDLTLTNCEWVNVSLTVSSYVIIVSEINSGQFRLSAEAVYFVKLHLQILLLLFCRPHSCNFCIKKINHSSQKYLT